MKQIVPKKILVVAFLFTLEFAHCQCVPTITSASNCTPAILTANTVNTPFEIIWYATTNNGTNIVADYQTIWGTNFSTIAAFPHPQDIFIDKNQNRYICDGMNSRVLRFAPGSGTGVVVAGGHGQGSALNQLNNPSGVYVDNAFTVYIADNGNNRVQKWVSNASSGTTVAGGNGAGVAANQLSSPIDVYLDASGNIFVSDANNNRIQKWAVGATSGATVAGNSNGISGNSNSQLWLPGQIYIDPSNILYICDVNNSRILKWPSGASSGMGVYSGQGPSGVTTDINGNIYVAHGVGNSNDGLTLIKLINGGAVQTTIAANLSAPGGIFLDASGNVYTSCYGNGTVLKFSPSLPQNTFSATGFGQVIYKAVVTYFSICTSSTSSNVTITGPPSESFGTIVSGPQSVCSGNSYTYTISPLPVPATSYNWTLPTGWSGSSTTSSITVIPNINNGSISVTATNACGTNNNNITLPITVNPLAVYPTSSIEDITNDANFLDNNCNLIANITTSGASPISGSTEASVSFLGSVQTYNGIPYVTRYYDITPSVNASSATATVTLYYTQADFSQYNIAANTDGLPLLPIDAADADNNKNNILITQMHGTGTAPGNYTGSTATLRPSSVIWNNSSSYWEVRFDVTGFSGFYLTTSNPNQSQIYYRDADGDGYGDPSNSTESSTQPAGYVTNSTDCNDTDPTKWRTGTFFFDHDRDGYTQGSTILCYGATIPEGFVLTENGDDCDDNNYDIHESFPFYADFDGDGYGAGIPLNVCARNASSPPPGFTINNLDCDDNDNTIYPGAPELCDGKDNDCNGFIDDGIQPPPPPSVSDVTICKYSNASLSANGVGTIGWYDAPVGGNWVAGGNNFITPSLVDNITYYVQDSTCTASAARTPVSVTVSAPSLTATASATRVCSGTPVTLTGSGAVLYSWSDGGGVFGINDATPFIPLYTDTYYFHGSDAAGCNGSASVTVVVDPGTIYYQDADGDGFGNPAVSTQSCVPLTGYVINNLDCDDTKILYADNDGDGYGAGVPAACGVANNTDCDDTDPNVYPYLPSVNIDGQFNTAMGICEGTLTTFTATPFYGGTAPSYQWKKNNINVGTNSNTYSDASLTNADNITCELTSNAACAINTKALSNSIFVNVHPLPIVSAGNYASYTTNDPPFSLSGTPVGGSFSGIGVTGAGNLFDPSIAGPGNHVITYYYADGNGCGNSATTSIHVTNYSGCTSAPMIGNITGATTACGIAGTSTSALYAIDNIPGATYVWTKSTSLIQIVSGQNTNSINVTFSSTFSSGTITVTVTNSCGNAVRTISITKKSPATPGTIAGITNACSYIGTSVKYVIAKVAGATSYTWIVGAGASIAGKTSPYTSSDTSINVTFSSSFTGGNITVNASNACGISAAKAISITNKVPAIPGTISGPTDVCNFIVAHTNVTYTINKVTDATSYQWLIPAGVNIISTNVTDTSIILNFPGSYTTGTIQVKAKAGCGDGAYRSLTVTKKLPSTPGAITTLGDICTSMYTGTNTVSYTITGNTTSPLPDSYIWTLTPTVSGSALIKGGNGVIGSLPNSFVETTGLSIQVQFYGNFTGGTLLVVAKRPCGTSNARTLTLTKNLPPVPSLPVASGTICSGVAASVSYTVSPNANTSSYIWSSPKGTKITGAQIKTPTIDTTTSNTITVAYPSNFTSGNLTVKARSVCGTSSAVTLAVSAAPCTILSNNLSKENNIATQRGSALIYPDPNNGDFILKIQSANKTDKAKIQLTDVLGQAIKEYTAPNDNGNIVLHVNERSLAAGIYFLKYKIGKEVKYVKFVVQK